MSTPENPVSTRAGDEQRGRLSGFIGGFAGATLIFLVSVLLVAGGVIFALFKWGPLGDKATIDSTTVAGSFDSIAELSAEEYNFTNVGKYNEEGREFAGWNIPFTGKDFLLTYNGAVKAGVKDMSDIDVSFDEGASTVVLSVPKVEVTSTRIDPDSITVYDQSMNPFNQFEVSDLSKFLASEEKAASDKAVSLGLLDRASERVSDLLTAQVNALIEGTDKAAYDVRVEWQ